MIVINCMSCKEPVGEIALFVEPNTSMDVSVNTNAAIHNACRDRQTKSQAIGNRVRVKNDINHLLDEMNSGKKIDEIDAKFKKLVDEGWL